MPSPPVQRLLQFGIAVVWAQRCQQRAISQVKGFDIIPLGRCKGLSRMVSPEKTQLIHGITRP